MAEDGEIEQNREVSPDFSKKHPLQNKWCLWFDNPNAKQSVDKYGSSLRSVYAFDTVEDFWCLYNNIRAPSQLAAQTTFYLFKEHIEPKWEDPSNAAGGCWTVQTPRGPGIEPKRVLDQWWLHCVLACIGEQFEHGEEICGIGCCVRNGKDRIELWTKTASNEAMQVSIGRQLKRTVLGLSDATRIGYGVFSEKLQPGKAKDRYTVE